MTRVKRIGLLAILALALTGVVGTGSASAGYFQGSSYPEMMYGNPGYLHKMTTTMGTVHCDSPAIWGELLGHGVKLETKVEDSNCYPFGVKSALKANGCKLIFHAGPKVETNKYSGTFDIGPAGCGPITTHIGNCDITIPAQTGLDASYKNVENHVEVNAEADTMTYTMDSGCNYEGVATGGHYEGTWRVDGYHHTGSASWSQVAADNHVFSAGGKTVTCDTATFAVTRTYVTQATAAPSYGSCIAFGFSATVNPNGCTYKLQATNVILPNITATTAIECPAGKSIEIVAGPCVVSVPAQSGLTGISLKDQASSLAVANVSGIQYAVTKDGFICPFSGLGTHSDGAYTGETSVSKGRLVSAGSWAVVG